MGTTHTALSLLHLRKQRPRLQSGLGEAGGTGAQAALSGLPLITQSPSAALHSWAHALVSADHFIACLLPMLISRTRLFKNLGNCTFLKQQIDCELCRAKRLRFP